MSALEDASPRGYQNKRMSALEDSRIKGYQYKEISWMKWINITATKKTLYLLLLLSLHCMVSGVVEARLTNSLLEDGMEVKNTGQVTVCDTAMECMNSGRCVEEACDCSGTDYEGSSCQFAKYRSSCGEYLGHGYNESGYYKVDLDGSGPLEPVIVWCDFEENKPTTVVQHNLPVNYAVRRTGWPSHQLLISYGELTKQHLVHLAASEQCQQHIKFTCTRASLQLSDYQTMFSFPQHNRSDYFSSKERAVCNCKDEKDCDTPNVSCNCDIQDGHSMEDLLVFTDSAQLPVTEAVYQGDNSAADTELLMTLSNLTCEEQEEPDYFRAVAFSNSSTVLKLGRTWKTISSLRFEFRTTQKQGKLVYASGISGKRDGEFTVIMEDDDLLLFLYGEQSNVQSLLFHTSYPLDSGEWQQIRIDFSHNQLRLTVNGYKKFLHISSLEMGSDDDVESELLFGGKTSYSNGGALLDYSYPGIIGCLRNIRVNNKAAKPPAHGSTVSRGCSCDPNPCHHEAMCKEQDFGQYECECSDMYREQNCEEVADRNAVTLVMGGSEVTALITNRSYVHMNPIINDFSFQFRTRQSEAFLFFAYDNYQNLLQIWLSNPYKLNIMFNSKENLIRMELNTGKTALNTGKPVKFSLQHSNQTTANVTVDGIMSFTQHQATCQQITEYDVNPFKSVKDTKCLPYYTKVLTLPEYFYEVYFGGARTYFRPSPIESLIGCISNYRVRNSTVNIQDEQVWFRTGSVQSGCLGSCSKSQPCRNGGTCLNVFGQDNISTPCDCDNTGYEGDYCDEETSYVFAKGDSVSFDTYSNLDLSSNFSVEFTVVLNISSENNNHPRNQSLLVTHDSTTGRNYGVEFSSNLALLIWASDSTDTGKLRTAILEPWPSVKHLIPARIMVTFAENAVVVKLSERQQTVQLKPDFRETHYSRNEHLSENLIIGGVNRQGFSGCISNIKITTATLKVFRPLYDLSQEINYNKSSSVLRKGSPRKGVCSSFREPRSQVAPNSKSKILPGEVKSMDPPIFQQYESDRRSEATHLPNIKITTTTQKVSSPLYDPPQEISYNKLSSVHNSGAKQIKKTSNIIGIIFFTIMAIV